MLLSAKPVMHAWLPDINIGWIKQAYLSGITELLFDTDVGDANEYYKTLTDDLTNQSSDILQHSQNRPTGDRWLKF